MIKNEILQKIDSLIIFGELLDEKNKLDYLNHLNKIKNEVSKELTHFINNFHNINPAQDKNKLINTPETKPLTTKLSNRKQNSFTHITKILVPNLTETGKKLLEDITTPILLYKSLKMINEKSSILEIYYMYAHKFNNYLEFINIIYDLQEKKCINFIKTEQSAKNDGWVLIGQILEECNIIDEENIKSALLLQQSGKSKQIGEALCAQKSVMRSVLKDGLKIQKWIAGIIDSSIFIEGIIHSSQVKNDDEDLLNENASNIMDFIIPQLSDSARHILKRPDTEFFDLLQMIDEKSSLLKIFEKNKNKFANKLDFLKLILKLDLQEFLSYKKNDELEKREAWIKFGALSMNLGLVSENQIAETFIYRHKNVNRQIYIGEALVELNFMTKERKIEILNLQRWCNMVLSKISYEASFITAIREILENNFNCPTEVGKFSRITLDKPLNADMIYIVFQIIGKLNGSVYYIFDKTFFENLTKNIMASYNMDMEKPDEGIIAEICNIITGSILTRLSRLGIFCQTNIPEVHIGDMSGISEKKVISVLPLMNQFGRFIIGFNLKSQI